MIFVSLSIAHSTLRAFYASVNRTCARKQTDIMSHCMHCMYFVLTYVTRTKYERIDTCRPMPKNSKIAFLRFVNLKLKFCFWGLCPRPPPGLCPWTAPRPPETWTPQSTTTKMLLRLCLCLNVMWGNWAKVQWCWSWSWFTHFRPVVLFVVWCVV